MGTTLAWVIVRYRFPGRRVLSTVVDLPLAVPTLVWGVMILVLYGPNSVIGRAFGHGRHPRAVHADRASSWRCAR